MALKKRRARAVARLPPQRARPVQSGCNGWLDQRYVCGSHDNVMNSRGFPPYKSCLGRWGAR